MQDPEDHGQLHERAEHQQGPRPLCEPRRCRPHVVLRGSRPQADDAGRAVGPVPVVVRHAHHQQEHDEVRVRPGSNDTRLRTPGGAVTKQAVGLRGAARRP